ncbi:unnamed protein product [Rotaria sp. Silwood2]|nr:unnamed protein product [Rotaria sp. Silwood2]
MSTPAKCTNRTEPSVIEDSLRLFTNWVHKKIYERDLTKDKITRHNSQWKQRTQQVLEIAKLKELSAYSIKNIISSFECLYNEEDFEFVKYNITMYAVIRFNRDFDILCTDKYNCSSLNEEQKLLKINIIKIHDQLFNPQRKLTTDYIDKIFINNQPFSNKLQHYLKLKDNEFTFTNILKLLYLLQQTDIKFQFLQSLPEFFFIYYGFPFYNVDNNQFYLEKKQMLNPLSSSTATTTITSTTAIDKTSTGVTTPKTSVQQKNSSSPSYPSITNNDISSPISSRLNNNNDEIQQQGEDEVDEEEEPKNDLNNNNNLQQQQTNNNNDYIDNNNDDEELVQRLDQLQNDMIHIPFFVRNSSLPSSTLHSSHSSLSHRRRPASSTSTNTDQIDPSHINQFEELHLKHKYTSLNQELDWFEMSTINTEKTNNKYVNSSQQTHLSGTTKIVSNKSTIINDMPPEIVFRNELNRKKRYENHLAILNMHKERNSYPSTLSSMPQPTIGNDNDIFIKEWNEILNDLRRRLMNKTIEHIEHVLNDINDKIESVRDLIKPNRRLEIESKIDQLLKVFIKTSWCKIIRHTIKPTTKISTDNNFGFKNDGKFPTINHFKDQPSDSSNRTRSKSPQQQQKNKNKNKNKSKQQKQVTFSNINNNKIDSTNISLSSNTPTTTGKTTASATTTTTTTTTTTRTNSTLNEQQPQSKQTTTTTIKNNNNNNTNSNNNNNNYSVGYSNRNFHTYSNYDNKYCENDSYYNSKSSYYNNYNQNYNRNYPNNYYQQYGQRNRFYHNDNNNNNQRRNQQQHYINYSKYNQQSYNQQQHYNNYTKTSSLSTTPTNKNSKRPTTTIPSSGTTTKLSTGSTVVPTSTTSSYDQLSTTTVNNKSTTKSLLINNKNNNSVSLNYPPFEPITPLYVPECILNKPLRFDPKLAELEAVHLSDIIYTIGNIKLTQHDINLLSKGLKFIPNKPFHLNDCLRLCLQEFLSSSKLFNQIKIDELLVSIFSNRKEFKKNLSEEEQSALIHLQTRTDIIIRPADKNVGIVILESNVYESKVLQQLQDTEFYNKLNYIPNTQIFKGIKFELNQLFNNKQIPYYILKLLLPIKPTCATFYILPKLHKIKCPGRPIVSGIQHVTSNISKYLERHLTPFISHLHQIAIDEYQIDNYIGLKDTNHLLIEIENINESRCE